MPSGMKCSRCVFGTACGLSSFVSPGAPSGRRSAHTSNPAKNGETTSANRNQLIPSRPRLLATRPTINANATQKGIIQNKKFPHSIPREILEREDRPMQVYCGTLLLIEPHRVDLTGLLGLFRPTSVREIALGKGNRLPKNRFSAEQIVTLLRSIELAMGQEKSTQTTCGRRHFRAELSPLA
jgi:hypothetical protein